MRGQWGRNAFTPLCAFSFLRSVWLWHCSRSSPGTWLSYSMPAWRSETHPRALLPFVFILAVTYHSADTDITTSCLSVCLLAGLLILNHGHAAQRHSKSGWSLVGGGGLSTPLWHTFKVVSKRERNGTHSPWGPARLCTENVCGGDEAMVGPFLRLEPQPASALIPVSWVTLSHIPFPISCIISEGKSASQGWSHNEQEKPLQPGVDPSAMRIYVADTLNDWGRISCSGGRPPPEVRSNETNKTNVGFSSACKM